MKLSLPARLAFLVFTIATLLFLYLPLVVVAIFLEKYIIKGMAAGAVK